MAQFRVGKTHLKNVSKSSVRILLSWGAGNFVDCAAVAGDTDRELGVVAIVGRGELMITTKTPIRVPLSYVASADRDKIRFVDGTEVIFRTDFRTDPLALADALERAALAQGGALKRSAQGGPLPPPPELIQDVQARSVERCTILGGYGLGEIAGENVTLWTDSQQVFVVPLTGSGWHRAIESIISVEVWGPGSATSGGGVMGGGFGLEGAALGVGLAAVANALTTSTSVESIVSVTTTDSEIHLQNSVYTPAQLRILLSPVIGRVIAAREARLTGKPGPVHDDRC